jgi:hypothetical protein
MKLKIPELESQLEILRTRGKHEEADHLQIEIGRLKAKAITGLMPSPSNPISNLIFRMSKPVKAKDESHDLYLVRFEEGTRLHFDFLEGIAPIRWLASTFIPVIGIEIAKADTDSVLEKVKAKPGFIRLQKSHLFHEHSFLEI